MHHHHRVGLRDPGRGARLHEHLADHHGLVAELLIPPADIEIARPGDRLGGGLVATAWAGDGTIEAIEDPSRGYLLGVQWHAELLIGRPQEESLFRSFVSAAMGTRVPVESRSG